ncbi:MAG TPA: LysR family transcriptional regulator [Verrucomicrobiales bacterium]|nr:LysR family transcriptional regulator [Verrucomicrobiales bacterium]
MDWLNYHHLYYFWVAAKEGSIGKASRALKLSQPTVSTQIKSLELNLEEPLFLRDRGGLTLTDSGRMAFEYAEEIFNLGKEFQENLKGIGSDRPARLRVGISDVMPKLVSHRLLAPALEMRKPVRLICEEDKTETLLADLSIHRLDLVIADAPIGGSVRIKAFNHFLGSSGVTFFGTRKLADRYRGKFPGSISGAPLLVPTEGTVLRRSIDRWLSLKGYVPRIRAEFHDSALLKVFGREGAGLFLGPTIIEEEICREYNVGVVGRTEEILESFYAITVERKVRHPVALAITQTAREKLFGDGDSDSISTKP